MKLIADSGATTTDWAAIDTSGEVIRFTGAGYNPYYISEKEIGEDIAAHFPKEVDPLEVNEVEFYGAGVRPTLQVGMNAALKAAFPNARIDSQSDTLGAARALLGREKGFASILGTGMNSCICEGGFIVSNIMSLGYALGDEGSGAYMGKRLVRDYLRGQMPPEALALTREAIVLEPDAILSRIYKEAFPNRWCAGFTKLIAAHLDIPYFKQLVDSSFRDLFENVVTHYPDYRSYEFNCCGSVGFVFRDILSKTCAGYGMKPGTFLKEPMDGLVAQTLKYMDQRN